MHATEDERRIPITNSRALTELVQSRRHLDAARRSLELAVELFNKLREETAGIQVAALEDVLGLLEEAEATLWETAL